MAAADVLLLLFARAFALAVGSVLRHAFLLFGSAAALFLQLDVNGTVALIGWREVNAHPIGQCPWPHCYKQVAELPFESFVEVKVDNGVVDVGAFGKESREHKALGGHVPVAVVEDKE